MSARFYIFVFLIAILSVVAPEARADSCDLKKLSFGISQDKLKSKFSIDEPEVSATGESIIRVAGITICKDMPETAIMEFILLDNNFVQMRIKNENQSSELFKYATTIFGEVDNKESGPKKVKEGDKIKRGLWAKDSAQSVIYTTYTEGRHNIERIVITSNKHKDLFMKINQAKVKAIDDHLKENKLGKYNPNYKDETPNAESDKKSSDVKINDAKKNNANTELKENDNDRGYHYKN